MREVGNTLNGSDGNYYKPCHFGYVVKTLKTWSALDLVQLHGTPTPTPPHFRMYGCQLAQITSEEENLEMWGEPMERSQDGGKYILT